ncbi:MAG: hypothetical protein AAF899_08545 [Pseudomonadota bacterium]
MFKAGALSLSLYLASVAAAGAVSIFSEDFADEAAALAPASGIADFTAFDQFSLDAGSTDLFNDGGFGLSCPSGGCLDLDGSSTGGATLTSPDLSFAPGQTYTLSLVLGGNDFRTGLDDNTTRVSITNGILGEQVITLSSSDAFATFSYAFTVAAPILGQVTIIQDGDDNFGNLLSSVVVDEAPTTVVPLPATGLLLISSAALLGLGSRIGRRGGVTG